MCTSQSVYISRVGVGIGIGSHLKVVPDPEPWWPSKWGDFPRLYKLFTDDYQGAYEVAREFCRLTNAEDRIHEILIAVADTSRATGFSDGASSSPTR